MNQVWLEELRVKNFKGIKSLQINFTTTPFVIRGENKAGKSSIYDAFSWLLFNKDSLGRANFQILPVDESGETLTGNEATVEALLNVNGENKVRLKKVFSEKFTKKRNGLKPVKTGHTNTYYINDMNSPVKEKDFKARVEALCPTNIFDLLTNPAAFFMQKWQEQRAQLFELCGDELPNEKDILADKKYTAIISEIEEFGYSLEEFQKALKSQIRKTKKEVEYLPIQIKERRQGIKKVKRPLLKDKEQLKLQLKKLSVSLPAENKLAEVQAEIYTLEGSKSVVEREIEVLETQKKNKHMLELKEIESQISDLTRKLETDEVYLSSYKNQLEDLRDKWETVASKEIKLDTVCPTCGQNLPEVEKLKVYEEAKNKKAETLKRIAMDGEQVKKKQTSLLLQIDKTKRQLRQLKTDLAEKQELAKKAENELTEHEQELYDTSAKIDSKIEACKKALENIESDTINDDADDTKNQIAAIEAQLADWETQQAEYEMMKNDEARIVKLKKEQKVVAESFELLQQKLTLVEEAIATKITGTLDAISAYFDTVSWKLFDKKINGEISQCCEAMVDGVLYDHGLNNGTKINAGLEVIKVLQDFYGYSMPIFIDNAECLSSVTPMPATQIIYLVVSGNNNEFSGKESINLSKITLES
jgi:DNA repair exonuclease SbcCD ATPase subunit